MKSKGKGKGKGPTVAAGEKGVVVGVCSLKKNKEDEEEEESWQNKTPFHTRRAACAARPGACVDHGLVQGTPAAVFPRRHHHLPAPQRKDIGPQAGMVHAGLSDIRMVSRKGRWVFPVCMQLGRRTPVFSRGVGGNPLVLDSASVVGPVSRCKWKMNDHWRLVDRLCAVCGACPSSRLMEVWMDE
ncbi:uncharacterized protein B0I36DRAFT_116071 [Microdochium trichocladiopsis]|uniref:Uncharacterized protein n=1 Tax=Microdochium trichocladiopsis TaxID=1682393 RepID=A0A9P8Y4A5_9PEZI|nr:uncharacterized protein B0I36DRAFT_116071 [Microdochium trichocladiopsis]KAH7030922.1 hypothetical protein B0I36DRAFT_116071 [Microdochium trichocladiopsis]